MGEFTGMGKRATAAEVAELAGVSRTTVSFVLNDVPGMRISEETRQRVFNAARKLNYHPDSTARRMVSGQTNMIGFVLRQSPGQAFSDHFLPQVLHGMSQVVSAQDFHLLFEVIPPEDQSGVYMKLINERHVDGIILSGPRSDDTELRRVYEQGANIVLIGQMPGEKIPYVDVNNIGGAITATQHLISLGHTRIGVITNAPQAYTASADRLTGYRHALEKAGMPYDSSLVRYGNFTVDSGYDAMRDLLSKGHRPTAVFVASDTVALGALQAIQQSGLRVPEDIALCGFDDIPLARFIDPPMTTIQLPAFGLGWAAAELLIRMISREEIKNPYVILGTELVIRNSCGALVDTGQSKSFRTYE
ncbi:MAG: LacI family DNA-binding transcriptional regulator [Anaerolineales bacterium]|nr:LacI family DNA-binding transcriptional regulator [Anaerolineales bacterium]